MDPKKWKTYRKGLAPPVNARQCIHSEKFINSKNVLLTARVGQFIVKPLTSVPRPFKESNIPVIPGGFLEESKFFLRDYDEYQENPE